MTNNMGIVYVSWVLTIIQNIHVYIYVIRNYKKIDRRINR